MGCGSSSPSVDPIDPSQFLHPGFSDKYQLEDLIGSGSYARVFKVSTISKPRRTYVAKVMEDSGWMSDFWSTRSIYTHEASMLKKIRHAHIVRYLDFFCENNFLYIVLEHLSGGELFQHLVARGRLSEHETRNYAQQILGALLYLHENKIIYRDVKADNFVFTDHRCQSLKMIDMGLAIKPGNPPLSEICGSPHYLAPELIAQHYGFPVDLWALGILIFLLLHGHYPFEAPSSQELVEHIVTGNISDRISDQVSDLGRAFILGLCEVEESKRLTAKEAGKHLWITCNDRKFLRKTVTDPVLVPEDEQKISPRTLRQHSLN